MAEVIQSMDRYYRDRHGIIVNVIGYDPIGQRVIYRRPNYEWECVAPLIVFRARFKRIDK
jgi:ribulose bisphosphate carboxylase small subunit